MSDDVLSADDCPNCRGQAEAQCEFCLSSGKLFILPPAVAKVLLTGEPSADMLRAAYDAAYGDSPVLAVGAAVRAALAILRL